jgi:hypothetical protein
MSTLVETSAALTLPEVKTGLVEWSWQNKYGVITETPIPKPGESLYCRPVGTDAYDAGKIIAANADGSYDFQIGTKVYRNVRNDALYGTGVSGNPSKRWTKPRCAYVFAPPACPVRVAIGVVKTRTILGGGTAPGNGCGQVGECRLPREPELAVGVPSFVQHPKQVSQTCIRAHVEVGDVVHRVRVLVRHAGVSPWILQKQRQPVVNFVGGLPVEVFHEVVDRPESEPVEPSFEKRADVGYVYRGGLAIEIAVFD